jgi:hypothetical protein
MAERRHRPPDETSEPVETVETTPEAVPGTMPLRTLHDAVQLIDQELDRQQRLYGAAGALREQFGASIQYVLTELVELDERRAALAAEVGELEARLVALRAEVHQAVSAVSAEAVGKE